MSTDIQAGDLVQLLSDYAPPLTPLQLLFPHGRAQPGRVRALIDKLVEVFGQQNTLCQVQVA